MQLHIIGPGRLCRPTQGEGLLEIPVIVYPLLGDDDTRMTVADLLPVGEADEPHFFSTRRITAQ